MPVREKKFLVFHELKANWQQSVFDLIIPLLSVLGLSAFDFFKNAILTSSPIKTVLIIILWEAIGIVFWRAYLAYLNLRQKLTFYLVLLVSAFLFVTHIYGTLENYGMLMFQDIRFHTPHPQANIKDFSIVSIKVAEGNELKRAIEFRQKCNQMLEGFNQSQSPPRMVILNEQLYELDNSTSELETVNRNLARTLNNSKYPILIRYDLPSMGGSRAAIFETLYFGLFGKEHNTKRWGYGGFLDQKCPNILVTTRKVQLKSAKLNHLALTAAQMIRNQKIDLRGDRNIRINLYRDPIERYFISKSISDSTIINILSGTIVLIDIDKAPSINKSCRCCSKKLTSSELLVYTIGTLLSPRLPRSMPPLVVYLLYLILITISLRAYFFAATRSGTIRILLYTFWIEVAVIVATALILNLFANCWTNYHYLIGAFIISFIIYRAELKWKSG